MRVLVIGMNYAPDLIGVAKYNTELCESLSAQGHDVRVISAPPYYPDWKIRSGYRSRWYSRQRLNDVDVIRAPIYVPARPSGAKRLLHHASFLLSAAIPSLWSALRWRPEIVLAVAPSLLSAPVAGIAARLTGATSWLHVQDMEVDAAFELGMLRNGPTSRKLMLLVERWILGKFDRISTISPQMVRCLQLKGIAPEKLWEFRNWIDTGVIVPGSKHTSIRTELGIAPTDIAVLYSGAMSNKQGLELIIEAAAATRHDHPTVQYILCGNGPARPELKQLATGLGNVHFLDLQPSERVSELLSTADIHLLPQRAQISDLVLPSKLAGMLASGRPVVAMAAPGTGIAHVVEGAGLVVSPGNVAELATAILVLAGNEGLRVRYGTVGRERAEQKWDRTSIIRAFERECLALLQQQTVATPHARSPARLIRSIEQVTTGSRRRPESNGRTNQYVRPSARSAGSSQE